MGDDLLVRASRNAEVDQLSSFLFFNHVSWLLINIDKSDDFFEEHEYVFNYCLWSCFLKIDCDFKLYDVVKSEILRIYLHTHLCCSSTDPTTAFSPRQRNFALLSWRYLKSNILVENDYWNGSSSKLKAWFLFDDVNIHIMMNEDTLLFEFTFWRIIQERCRSSFWKQELNWKRIGSHSKLLGLRRSKLVICLIFWSDCCISHILILPL